MIAMPSSNHVEERANKLKAFKKIEDLLKNACIAGGQIGFKLRWIMELDGIYGFQIFQ